MRILPSQSSVMNRHVGSTSGLTTVEVEPVALADRRPVVDARTAQRVGADAHAGRPDRVDVDDVAAGRRRTCRGSRMAAPRRGPMANGTRSHAVEPGREQLVGAAGDPAGRVGVGRPAVGRVVLEPAVVRRVVRGRDDDPVGQAGSARAPAVGAQDGVRHRRRRRVAVGGVDQHGDTVGGEHLEGADPRRLRQGVGVPAEEQRPVDALLGAVLADRLRGGEDVSLVERARRGSSLDGPRCRRRPAASDRTGRGARRSRRSRGGRRRRGHVARQVGRRAGRSLVHHHIVRQRHLVGAPGAPMSKGPCRIVRSLEDSLAHGP